MCTGEIFLFPVVFRVKNTKLTKKKKEKKKKKLKKKQGKWFEECAQESVPLLK